MDSIGPIPQMRKLSLWEVKWLFVAAQLHGAQPGREFMSVMLSLPSPDQSSPVARQEWWNLPCLINEALDWSEGISETWIQSVRTVFFFPHQISDNWRDICPALTYVRPRSILGTVPRACTLGKVSQRCLRSEIFGFKIQNAKVQTKNKQLLN